MNSNLNGLKSSFDKIKELEPDIVKRHKLYDILTELSKSSFEDGMTIATDIWKPKTQD